MPPRRSSTRSATPSKSRSRSQSKGRGSASPRASTKATARTSTSPRRSSAQASPRASTTLSASQSPLMQEMRQVEAILANRRGKDGAPPPIRVGPQTTQRNGWGYWAAIVLMELLVLVWCRWAYDLFSRSVASKK